MMESPPFFLSYTVNQLNTPIADRINVNTRITHGITICTRTVFSLSSSGQPFRAIAPPVENGLKEGPVPPNIWLKNTASTGQPSATNTG